MGIHDLPFHNHFCASVRIMFENSVGWRYQILSIAWKNNGSTQSCFWNNSSRFLGKIIDNHNRVICLLKIISVGWSSSTPMLHGLDPKILCCLSPKFLWHCLLNCMSYICCLAILGLAVPCGIFCIWACILKL